MTAIIPLLWFKSSPSLQQKLSKRPILKAKGKNERRLVILSYRFYIGAVIEQTFDNGLVALLGSRKKQ
ncbi:hypothetical protein MKX08_003310 [Trichoderma sp. CBMAI-0020]|nr:hypothetical protein MKX08_003310 [Trichoderma sp. CBMAI-0020]